MALTYTDTDFIGFTYGDVHSSTLGLVRTSDSNRFQKKLSSDFKDTTTQPAGGNGTFYFGTQLTGFEQSVSFAFDHLTEGQFNNLSKVFDPTQTKDLIFDETPYKVMRAKPKSAPQLKFVCFDEIINGKRERIYKGEGTVNFVSYSPYWYSPKGKFCLDDYDYEVYKNKEQWAEASGLPEKLEIGEVNAGKGDLKVTNYGDLPTYPILKLALPSDNDRSIWINLLDYQSDKQYCLIDETTKYSDWTHLVMDNFSRTIYLKNEISKKVKVANYILAEGGFISIPPKSKYDNSDLSHISYFVAWDSLDKTTYIEQIKIQFDTDNYRYRYKA